METLAPDAVADQRQAADMSSMSINGQDLNLLFLMELTWYSEALSFVKAIIQ